MLQSQDKHFLNFDKTCSRGDRPNSQEDKMALELCTEKMKRIEKLILKRNLSSE